MSENTSNLNVVITKLCRNTERLLNLSDKHYVSIELNALEGFDGNFSNCEIDIEFHVNDENGEMIRSLKPIIGSIDLESCFNKMLDSASKNLDARAKVLAELNEIKCKVSELEVTLQKLNNSQDFLASNI